MATFERLLFRGSPFALIFPSPPRSRVLDFFLAIQTSRVVVESLVDPFLTGVPLSFDEFFTNPAP